MGLSYMGLLDCLNLTEYDTPGVVAGGGGECIKENDIYHIVTIKRISNGKEILLCTKDPAPEEAVEEAERLGLPIFTESEILHVRAAVDGDPERIEKIIELKKAFPYSVFRFRPEGAI